MINVESIKRSELISDPWPHKIIENILSPELYFSAKIIANKIINFGALETKEAFWLPDIIELFNLKSEAEDIRIAADQLLDSMSEISEPFVNRLESKLGYFNNPRFNITLPNSSSSIHDEGTNKTMVLVVYLEPEKSIGTLLFEENNQESFSKEIKWKPNTGFLMYSIPNKTWHKVISESNIRVTLNFYFEKIEALQNLNKNLDLIQMDWLYKQFSENKLIRTFV